MAQRLIAVLVLGSIAACSYPVGIAAESDPPIRTDRTSYDARTTSTGLELAIEYTFTNPAGGPVYVVNCNGIAPPTLEKWVDGTWVRAWSPIVPMCLSPPIVVQAGSAYTNTLRVSAGHPSNSYYPKFEVDEVEGVYRLVWWPLRSYDEGAEGFGELLPLEQRVSNSFLIKR